MKIEIIEAKGSKELKQFVQVPFSLYKKNPYWVPPLKSEELKSLCKEKNPAFEFCEVKLWLAFLDGVCVGRIGGIINKLHNDKTGEKNARLTRFECIDNHEIAAALLKTAEKWAKEKGMTNIHGPLGFSNLDHQGLLIEGFDFLPSVASEYHHEYYKKFFEEAGYEKEVDWVEFRITFPDEVPAQAIRVSEMVQKRYNLKVVQFKTNQEILDYKDEIFNVFNEAFQQLYSTFPFNKKMIDYYCDKYFKILNPQFVKVIKDKEDQTAGFIIALPSLSKAMQKANGKLFPCGWWHLKKALKHPIEADLMLTGVLPNMLNMGVSSVLLHQIWETMHQHKIKFVETTGMLETNTQAIGYWKLFDHIQHKRKRSFIKKL